MTKCYTDPNDFAAVSDSAAIQAAVNEAERNGTRRVIVPRTNLRTGKNIWIIDKTILLPSHISVELEGAHLRMADGVFCSMFENSFARQKEGSYAEGTQEGISLLGRAGAVLDGGKHNGLREPNSMKDGFPHISNNLTVFFRNVKNFRIDGITVRDQRWWGIALAWCREGTISNIHFELTERLKRGDPENPWRNQDGIDLRVGCHHIEIFNITGETGDDVVALTALAGSETAFENIYNCPDFDRDIHHISIHHVSAFCNRCAIVRLLCHFGNKIRQIRIDSIMDATPDREEDVRTGVAVKLGENCYCSDPDKMCRHGDLCDVQVSGVLSSALTAVACNCSVKNVILRDITVTEKGKQAFSAAQLIRGAYRDIENPEKKTVAENVLIDGVITSSEEEPFFFHALSAKNVRISHLFTPSEKLYSLHCMEELGEGVVFEK